MKKILNLLFGFLLLFTSCSKEESDSFVSFAVDMENCKAQGSFVQGTSLNEHCQLLLPYTEAEGGVATFSSEKVNGMYVDPVDIAMEKGKGTATVLVKGSPLTLGLTYIPVNIDYMGHKYLATVSLVVFEDDDPNGTVTFSIDKDSFTSITDEVVVEYQVTPTMSAVTYATDATGLSIVIEQDPATGKGIIKMSPSEFFLSANITFTTSFGARPEVSQSVFVSAFKEGNGTVDAPYLIQESAHMKKLNTDEVAYFKLASDIQLPNWTPAGTETQPFVGHLDGDNHMVTFILNNPNSNNQALFGYIGSGSSVKNLKLAGSVTGADYVAGLAANSAVTPVNCDASAVNVVGNNHLAFAVASGAGKDPLLLSVGTDFPTMINIPAGQTAVSMPLDIQPASLSMAVEENPTGATFSYNTSSGALTVDIAGASFLKGDVKLQFKYAPAGQNGSLVMSRSIQIDSKKMNEGGTGTFADPYLVADEEQLITMLLNKPDSYISLKNDIALQKDWLSIANFSGTLNGNGHQIKGLKMKSTTANGGFISVNNGVVRNIEFTAVNCQTTASFGAVVGNNKGTVENVCVEGSITSTNTGDILGGIVGTNAGTGVVNNCFAHVDLVASCGMVGGIVGKGTGSKILRCTSEGTISITAGKTRIGGILGRSEGAEQIRGCWSKMDISTTTTSANGMGGIFGANNNNGMLIEECMFTGSVAGANDIGGIAGVAANVKNCLVENATLRNSVAPSNGSVGGVCGTNKLYADKCIVRSASIQGVVGAKTASVAGISSFYQNNGKAINCLVLNTTVKGGLVNRISGEPVQDPLSNNWSFGVLLLDSSGQDMSTGLLDDASGRDGGSLTVAPDKDWYQTQGFDLDTVWNWDGEKLVLRNVGYQKY